MRLPRARHEFLLRELQLRGSVRSADVAEALGVSEVTIRRDVVELDRQGLLARVHGGAIALTAEREPAPARTLAGLVVPSPTGHFAAAVRGAESVAASRRVRLVLGGTDYVHEIEERQVRRLLSLGVEGLLIAPTTRDRDEDEIAEWVSSIPVPCVILERRFATSAVQPYDYVRTDHAYGAALAVEHFARLGHDAVAIAVFDRTPTASSVRAGHRAAVERLGLRPAPDLSLPKSEEDRPGVGEMLERLLRECRSSGTRAVLVHTDDHATRLVELALDRGVDVPGDLAIIAYDDEFADLCAVPLTAVSPPRHELGREGLRLLLDHLATPDEARSPRHLDLLPRLMVRDSCGGAR
ncbi:LacI family DNA-binding transcriptional regulator [Pseudactinotalea sp.]|uniref:LacI family DNA-binding transcriptional regulator n=1 Tax=Pseudactinotalea sp. TaxID=1926260 RepID=UPI003B3AE1A4